MFRRSMLIWLSIIPLAILNGVLRDEMLTPLIGSLALPLSGIILCGLIFIVALLFIPLLGKNKPKNYVQIGILWVIATVVFEIMFAFVSGDTLVNVLHAYNITTGNLWAIVVIFVGLAPWLAAKIKRII